MEGMKEAGGNEGSQEKRVQRKRKLSMVSSRKKKNELSVG